MSAPNKEATHIILFYKYYFLSANIEQANVYVKALQELCKALELKGRILVSNVEGINGTLAGNPKTHVEAFTHALLGPKDDSLIIQNDSSLHHLFPIIETFWHECHELSQITQRSPLTMSSQDDFKWSSSTKSPSELFPDLNVKLVRELIGTGGLLSEIVSIEETARGYLTPSEWDVALRARNPNESILIDCRNTKEYQIGHFRNAMNPRTNTFSQFPQWVRDNQSLLHNKQVYMYCTGGIRCEKASAYIRKVVSQVKDVYHLKGGIHKYLEAFPKNDTSMWNGKNFVFDGRIAQEATSAVAQDNANIVGHCIYCKLPFDSFLPENICTVCREPTLVCDQCKRAEIHCEAHQHLRNCYFHNLTPFSKIELQDHLQELKQHLARIAVGRTFKQKRKTLQKQCDKIQAHLDKCEEYDKQLLHIAHLCRSCGDAECIGACWGFHSLKRKERLDESKLQQASDTGIRAERRSANQRVGKLTRKRLLEDEMVQCGLRAPASAYRDSGTCLRVPHPCVRVMEANVKGKWCGKSILDVLKHEFVDVYKDLDNILQHGLLRVNNNVVTRQNTNVLKNMDTIQRHLHWHEPPILVPPKLSVQRIRLPTKLMQEYNLDADSMIIVCDKPTTVPVHPAGPYLANTLTIMVEAQEGFNSTLKPCHRLDRATSGLTICSPCPKVSKLVQVTMMQGYVKKLYIAKVHGNFSVDEADSIINTLELGTVMSMDEVGTIQVCAPIEVEDHFSGTRRIGSNGKACISRFRLVHYNEVEGASIILCYPITGRGHQLRVHLKSLGHPIVGDVLYGGSSVEEVPLDTVVSFIQKQAENLGGNSYARVSAEEMKTVLSSCRSCRDGPAGIQGSMSGAQLLQGGHSICLHALRYSIDFRKRKSLDSLATLEMEVGLPSWAVPYRDALKLSWI